MTSSLSANSGLNTALMSIWAQVCVPHCLYPRKPSTFQRVHGYGTPPVKAGSCTPEKNRTAARAFVVDVFEEARAANPEP